MDLARVIGSAVATAKTPGLSGRPLLIVQPVDVANADQGQPYVAVDRVGAGAGEVVLTVRGSAARVALGQDVEVDAAVVAIVDRIDLDGSPSYRKG
jgi:ethanolamine utilization protein EutN